MTPIRIVLVDDHPVFRQGLQRVLEQAPGFRVVAQTDTVAQARSLLEQTRTDVIVLDISLRGESGLDLLATLRGQPESPAVLVLSMHDEGLYADRALRAGAAGYLSKDAEPEAIREAVRRAVEAPRPEAATEGAAPTTGPRLTDRELEVLQLLASGRKTAAIAAQLGISTKTLESHRAHIKAKFGVQSPAELLHVAFALFPQLAPPPPRQG